ncbi:TPA: hypothetical protein ACJEU7_001499 [Acinetobacter baumannii]|uniref:hypothetical protein n=1 Tax=Acinetobacter baumannii TaxID=470 RepID=UPI00225469D1|nr:hypothetical protein [Acinetobacter baumannii]MCX3035278.1 hypothetical protein [Acinetobacter baumannii]
MNPFVITHIDTVKSNLNTALCFKKRKYLLLLTTNLILFCVFVSYFKDYHHSFAFLMICFSITIMFVQLLYKLFLVNVGVNSDLNGDKKAKLSKVAKYYPEIKDYIENSIKKGSFLTIKDYLYLSVDKRFDTVLKHELFQRIEKISNIEVDRQEFTSHVLDGFKIDSPFTLEELEQKKKQNQYFYLGAFLIISVLMSIYLNTGLVGITSSFMQMLVTAYVLTVLTPLFVVGFRGGDSDLELALDDSYADIETLASVDNQVVAYISEVKDQGRLLLKRDLKYMEIDLRLKMLKKVSFDHDFKK